MQNLEIYKNIYGQRRRAYILHNKVSQYLNEYLNFHCVSLDIKKEL